MQALTLAPAAAAIAVALAGCPGKPASESRAGGQARTPATQVVRVVFDLPGDDIGGPEARALLEDVKAEILQRQLGRLLRSGFGMGEAEIVLEVQGDDTPENIGRAIESVRPQAKYRIVPGEH